MDNSAFRIFVIGGIILSIFVSKINKLIGGIVSLLVTTGILIYGLDVYSRPGWILTIFGIEVSQGIFIILIVAWYIFDIKQILDGIKEGKMLRDLKSQAADKIRTGMTGKDVLEQMVSGLKNQDGSNRELMKNILHGKGYRESIEEIMNTKRIELGNAVLLYQTVILVINDLQQIIISEGKRANIPMNEREMKSLVLPSVKVFSTKTISMTKKLNKNDLIFSYNNKLVTSFEELREESLQTSSESKVPMGILYMEPQTKTMAFRQMEVKGGEFEIKAETNQ